MYLQVVDKVKTTATAIVTEYFNALLGSADLKAHGLQSINAEHITQGRGVRIENIDTNRFVVWVNGQTGLKHTTIERRLRELKAKHNR